MVEVSEQICRVCGRSALPADRYWHLVYGGEQDVWFCPTDYLLLPSFYALMSALHSDMEKVLSMAQLKADDIRYRFIRSLPQPQNKPPARTNPERAGGDGEPSTPVLPHWQAGRNANVTAAGGGA